MPTTTTPSGIEIYYETVGSPTDPPLLMVMGYGSQLIAWPRAFSEALAAGGRFVIEFDNRDSGLRSKLEARRPRGRHGRAGRRGGGGRSRAGARDRRLHAQRPGRRLRRDPR